MEIEKNSNTLTVVMSNELTKSAHGLTLIEKRVLMLAISKLDSRKPATPQNLISRITVSELIKEYGIDPKSAYKQARQAIEHLMGRYIRFYQYDTKGKCLETRMQWVGQANYKESEGWLELEFWHRLSPMLFELKQQFTQYKLSRAGAMRSMYSWRLFELLMQFKKTGLLKIGIDDFNFALETPDSLRANFANLRNRVIDPAIKEIREKDGLDVTWEATKTGRKVTALTFKFPIEQQTELPLAPTAASKPPKRRREADTDLNPQDALSRYNGLKSMAELSSLQQLASEQEWDMFQKKGWVV